MNTKECFKCHEVKPLTDYYKHGGMRDGRLNKCKECTKADVSFRRIEKIDYVREYDRKRGRTKKRKDANSKRNRAYYAANKEKVLAQKRRWTEENKEKRAAHTLLGNALARGALIRGPCEVCGTTTDVQGHHTDYCKPLEVNWLCRDHHKKLHRKYP